MEEKHIIELVDEDTGETRNYVYVATLTRDDVEYAVLEPEDDEGDEIEVLIFQLSEPDEEDCCELIPLEDEALIDELFNEYVELVENEDEWDDEDEDEDE